MTSTEWDLIAYEFKQYGLWHDIDVTKFEGYDVHFHVISPDYSACDHYTVSFYCDVNGEKFRKDSNFFRNEFEPNPCEWLYYCYKDFVSFMEQSIEGEWEKL